MNKKITKIVEGKPTMLLYDIQKLTAPHTIFTKGEIEKNELIDFLQKGMKLQSVVVRIDPNQNTNDKFGLKLTDDYPSFFATFFTHGNVACSIEALNDIDVIIIDLPGSVNDSMFDILLENIRVELQEDYLYGAKKFVFVIDRSSSWNAVGNEDSKPFFESFYYINFRPIECDLVQETTLEAEMTHCLQHSFDNPLLDNKEAMSNLLKKYISASK
jgi:hypothetical protein